MRLFKQKTMNWRSLLLSAVALTATVQGRAQNAVDETEYSVQTLGTLGGTFSTGNSVNNRGWVAGQANLQGDLTGHAFLWTRKSGTTDLGTLGGPDSTVGWPVRNDIGLIVGASDTADPDPLSEDFCSFGTGMICLAFAWHKGQMTPLGTLGGNNSFAVGANNRGQIIGFAETSPQDPSCSAPQVFDWEPVIWGPEKGQIQQLPLLSGDITGVTSAINNSGQVVGGTGRCGPIVGRFLSHAVLWQNGAVTDLGNLGGAIRNFASGINDRGQVIGHSDLPGDVLGTGHAFLWTKDDGMQDLGTLPGHSFSWALAINNQGQVVGESCDQTETYCRAFLWQDGVMVDLNALIPPGSPLLLYSGADINDRGEITGQAINQSTGEWLAFLAVPTREGGEAMHSEAQARDKALLPDNVRERLRQAPVFRRFKAGLLKLP